ncbi:CCR4-NOT transcription complex subunit 11 [Anopheles arabiensis]|uniref:CCR4-NOT transcription complex subunit 11 n=1 Tax=Anopheles arabiensis TaxID=7173 RepID=A0A2C9GRR2_ANOAR|nr:CCR4-NOT transcription complex subunit 11 [Anopheles arabiensis]
MRELYDLITGKNVDHQTFESVSAIIQKRFTNAGNWFQVGSALALLLLQNDLALPFHRLAGIYVLYDIRRKEQAESPFFLFLARFLEPFGGLLPANSSTPAQMVELKFIHLLLSNGDPDIDKKSPRLFCQAFAAMPTPVGPAEIAYVKAKAAERLKDFPLTVRSNVANIIPALPVLPGREPALKNYTGAAIEELVNGMTANPSNPLLNALGPTFMSVAPPLLTCEDELIWLDLGSPSYHKPVYNSCSDAEPTPDKCLQTLLDQSFRQALSIADQQTLVNELEKDTQQTHLSCVTPEKLPNLIEYNPTIAIEILMRMLKTRHIDAYLDVIVDMELSLHSMEVVNRLTTSVDLPVHFVHLYIVNSIGTCSTIRDKYMQNRLVRLVCVFLQSLIRNKIIDVKQLYIEIEAFCIEFSRIREAAALYRLLKQLELDQGSTAGTSGTAPATTGGGSVQP